MAKSTSCEKTRVHTSSPLLVRRRKVHRQLHLEARGQQVEGDVVEVLPLVRWHKVLDGDVGIEAAAGLEGAKGRASELGQTPHVCSLVRDRRSERLRHGCVESSGERARR